MEENEIEVYNFNDAQKYILDQAKIEIEHTRSWPTKVMAFYVAIYFGLVGSLIALQKSGISSALSCWTRVILTIIILVATCWVGYMLGRNHFNYLKYRNLLVNFQMEHLQNLKGKYEVPDEWFKINKMRLSTRFLG